jgi:hypothetical protein
MHHAVPLMQVIIASLQVALTAVLGWLTFRIAKQQTATNRSQLRYNLFNKRFEVFEAAMKFVTLVAMNHTASLEERIEFVRKTKAARFLFNEEAAAYFSHVDSQAVLVEVGQKLIAQAGAFETKAGSIALLKARIDWFDEQLALLPKDFDRFLAIEGSKPDESRGRPFSARFTEEEAGEAVKQEYP